MSSDRCPADLSPCRRLQESFSHDTFSVPWILPRSKFSPRKPDAWLSRSQPVRPVCPWLPLLQSRMSLPGLHGCRSHPKYKSRYYETGYPDDGYGVCTDVVAYALKNAGYNLQELVDADIREQPQDYMVEEPDVNIDFRRVRNLKVFFAHTAAALTTDVSEIEEWQGGDIVIFERHIGIVSDRRNKNGVPYIIHHNDPWQTAYEQDILEKRTDIVGHYRISK